MDKPCRQISPTYGSRSSPATQGVMAIGNGHTTVIDIGSSVANGNHVPIGALCTTNGTLSPDGTPLPHSALTKIANEIAEASATIAHPKPKFEPEPFKTVMAIVYGMSVSFLSAFTITYTHDRTPDVSVNPPLPDLVFELVPRMEWAFLACEICMLSLAAVNVINLVIHKHRLIILRRCLVIIGFTMTMRCLTMLVTSLSVTGYHVHCGRKMYDSVWSKLGRAVSVSIGMGMTVTGAREELCGDYIYSGHTVSITAFCLFFIEYTPSKCRLMHFLVRVTGASGIFFIVAAHEHYTVDVLVAIIVTVLLFLYYHTLANTRAYLHRDLYKVRVWFPFFHYLEAKVDGVVPNEYEWPFRIPSISWPRCPSKLWQRKQNRTED
ncbi:sphingomyelin synthase-related protein 1-like [Asterias rubens]|uniref:sphingomyelin synthase-related protein 1-like n=1 Tax=Asterias rubens TaxID=7604 RepID=UPI0014552B62|nr:sphingomyelin synthase-related protein 1-like [Asterias rubens]